MRSGYGRAAGCQRDAGVFPGLLPGPTPHVEVWILLAETKQRHAGLVHHSGRRPHRGVIHVEEVGIEEVLGPKRPHRLRRAATEVQAVGGSTHRPGLGLEWGEERGSERGACEHLQKPAAREWRMRHRAAPGKTVSGHPLLEAVIGGRLLNVRPEVEPRILPPEADFGAGSRRAFPSTFWRKLCPTGWARQPPPGVPGSP